MALIVDNSPSSCGGGDGGMLLSLDSHKSVPAPFLTKTYQLVDDPSTDHVVSWGEDDSTFVVWRPPEFARDLLPNYFKHNNFSSFVRQLNTYGFRKIVPDRWEFANDFFKKGEKHLLCEIHRRKTAQLPPPPPPHHHHHHHPGGFFPFSNRLSISPSDDSLDDHYFHHNHNNWSRQREAEKKQQYADDGVISHEEALQRHHLLRPEPRQASPPSQLLRR
ncbi:Heat stress transcription factor B-4 [Linum perenne]